MSLLYIRLTEQHYNWFKKLNLTWLKQSTFQPNDNRTVITFNGIHFIAMLLKLICLFQEI